MGVEVMDREEAEMLRGRSVQDEGHSYQEKAFELHLVIKGKIPKN